MTISCIHKFTDKCHEVETISELTTIDYALRYYLEQNPNLDEEDIEWCTLVREKVDSIIVSQVNYDMECG